MLSYTRTRRPRWSIVALGLLALTIAGPPPQAKNGPRRDLHGDPLPPGAVARLGTLRFRINAQHVEKLAFSPDGKTLAAASPNGLWLLDASTGNPTRSIRPPNTDFQNVAFSADGRRLLAFVVVEMDGQRKKLVQIWDVASGQKTSETELGKVLWLGWSAEGQPLAICQREGEIDLCKVGTGRGWRFIAKDLPDPNFPFSCDCAVGKNVLAAAAGNGTGLVHVWDMSSGEKRYTLKPGGYVAGGLAISPDERWLAWVFSDKAHEHAVQLWDLTTGKAGHILAADQKELADVAYTADGKTLITIGRKEIRFWDAASEQERRRIEIEHIRIALSPDGKTLAMAEFSSGAIQLWDVASGTRKPAPEGHTHQLSELSHASFSPDGKRVATNAILEGAIIIWDAATGEPLARIQRSVPVCECAFSADGRTLYSCWRDAKLYFHDAATGRELHVLQLEDPGREEIGQPFLSLHLSDDGNRLIVISPGNLFARNEKPKMLLTGWDAVTRKQLFRREREATLFIAVSPDGRTLAVSPARIDVKTLYLEDLATGEPLRTVSDLEGWPMTFSPDGRSLISYAEHQAIAGKPGIVLRLWEVLTGGELWTSPTSNFYIPALSSDSSLLATVSIEGQIIVWDLRTGKERHRFHGFDAKVTSLAFSPDGRRLVSGLSDSTLLVWNVPSASGPTDKLGADGVAKAWADLASTDAPRGFRARGALASSPAEALPLLKEHLRPARPADAQRLRRLLTDLESEQFAVREKAQTELQELGDLAEPALRQTLADKPSLEVRRRVQAVLEHLRGPVTQPEVLRSLRAVAVLEDIATPEACRLLETLATGADEARLTREAKAALWRLQRRVPAAP